MRKKFLTILLAVTVTLAMSFAGVEAAFAVTDVGSPTELTLGEQHVTYNYDDSAITYYKVKSPSNGYFKIKFEVPVGESLYGYNVDLLNYKTTNLFKGSSYISGLENETNIGVGKGTYYIAVKTYNDSYGITVTHTAVSEKSGSGKSKAVRLYKGYSKKGIVTAGQGSKTGDWYKIVVKKTQKVKISVSTKTSDGSTSVGGIKVELYQKGSSSCRSYFTFTEYGPSNTIQLYTIGANNKLKPGTYYFKVMKYNNGNGYYKIKWL